MVRLHALSLIAVAPLAAGCAHTSRDRQPDAAHTPAPAPMRVDPNAPTVEVLAHTVIPPDHPTFGRIGGLSGALFRPHRSPEGVRSPLDPRGMAPVEFVSDHPDTPRTLHAGLRLTPTDDGPYEIEIRFDYDELPDWSRAKDAEAIARITNNNGELYAIAFEDPPTIAIREFDPDSRWQVRHHLPAIPPTVTNNARINRAFESVAITGDGTVWAATEAALTTDGPGASTDAGTRCVVLTGDADAMSESYFYETDPMPSHLGERFAIHSLVELEALPGNRLLAMERSLTLPAGYAATLYLIDGTTQPATADARLPVLNKAPIADLGALMRETGVPWVGNLEGLALGPSIATLTGDDTQSGCLLLVVADDNFGADAQKTGTQVVALRWREPPTE
ncbi:MAG: esterase-like activity of phytase family protein [Planctomycetota bacterium]